MSATFWWVRMDQPLEFANNSFLMRVSRPQTWLLFTSRFLTHVGSLSCSMLRNQLESMALELFVASRSCKPCFHSPSRPSQIKQLPCANIVNSRNQRSPARKINLHGILPKKPKHNDTYLDQPTKTLCHAIRRLRHGKRRIFHHVRLRRSRPRIL